MQINDTTSNLAHILHDTGLGAWFGGALMGTVGLNAAASQATDPKERAAIADAGWVRWSPWSLAAIGAHLAGATVLTATNRRRLVAQSGVGSLSLAKAGLTAAALGATAYARYVGRQIEKAGRVPVTGPTRPSDETPADVARWQRQERVLQWAVPALTGALVVAGSRMSEQQKPGEVLTGLATRLIPGA